MQERYKKLGKNTLLVFLGKAGSSIIGLLMLPFYTHWLSKGDYGTADLIKTYSYIFSGILSCGLGDAIFVYGKNADNRSRTRYFSSGLLYILVTIILLSLLLAGLHFGGERYGWKGFVFEQSWYILFISASYCLCDYCQAFTRSIDKMQVYSLTGIVHFGTLALFSLFLIPRFSLDGYLYAICFSNLVSAFFSVTASGANKYFSARAFNKEHFLKLARFGLPLVPNLLMWWLISGLSRPVMENYLGLEALGIYAVAGKFPSLLLSISVLFSTAWTITIMEEFGKPDFNEFFNRTVKMLFFFTTLGACILSALSKVIIAVFADSSYFEAWKYVPVLTLANAFQCFSTYVGGIFSAMKASKYYLYRSIWAAAVSVIATFAFIKLWGIQGAAIAVAASYFVMGVLSVYYAWKYIDQMKIGWYILLTILVIVVVIDPPLYFSIPSYLLIVSLICLLSRDCMHPLFKFLLHPSGQ